MVFVRLDVERCGFGRARLQLPRGGAGSSHSGGVGVAQAIAS